MVVCEECSNEVSKESMAKAVDGEKTEWPATCATCGESTTVPFKPNEKWPVYCRGCYGKRAR